jgi:cellulose synthase/poly-beta-1,6-N-acetylglucosamine synthase-like glycosyltransferase
MVPRRSGGARDTLMAVVTSTVVLLLVAFTLRRCVYLLASLRAPRPARRSHRFSVAVLGSFRNEEVSLPHLLDALDALDFPTGQLSFTLVSDGSSDRTPELLKTWAATRHNAHVIIGPGGQGKAAALNLAMRAARPSDLIAVYDADTWPSPSHLSALAGAFEDPAIAAASGLLLPVNAGYSIVSRYAALETWVYQTVILAGKDRCGVNPPVVGSNCIYRRKELEMAGGFPPGSFSEDIELSLAFVKRGFRTRWIRSAESRMVVVTTLSQFLQQRARWTSGLYRSGRQAGGIESWLTAAGYADRLILLAALCLVIWGPFQAVWIAIYLAAPFATLLLALLRAPHAGARWMYFVAAPPMLAVDIVAAATSTLLYLTRRRIEWRTGGALRIAKHGP